MRSYERLLVLLALVSGLVYAADAGRLELWITSNTWQRAGRVLGVVLPEVVAALSVDVRRVESRRDATSAAATIGSLPVLVLDVSTARSPTAAAGEGERYEVLRRPDGVIDLIPHGLLGVAYCLHDLREHLLLRTRSTHGAPSAEELSLALASFTAPPPPVYSLRTWSEEGQLLDLPDRSYYDDSSPSGWNDTLVAAEAAALEGEVVPALLRLRMNSLTLLHSDLEDYVTYATLPSFLPGAPAVYPPGDPHFTRAKGIAALIGPWVAHLAQDFGLAVFFQPYELSSPPGACAAAEGSPAPLFNCTLGSLDLLPLISAKYSEFFASVPAAAGIVVTSTDSWTPRAGYNFSTLWSGTDELAAVAMLFHTAINGTAGKRMIFRLWTLGKAVDWPTLRDGTPPGTEFSVKQSSGDFLLDAPLNPILNCSGSGGGSSSGANASCAPRERPFTVLVDAFRQYNGWTSGVCFMGSQWAPRLAVASSNGASGINGWGSWAPGCTWPDSGPSLINYTAASGGYKSWRGWWNSYRMFNSTPTNGGFGMGAQANAYLLYRLSWDASADPTDVAQDFGTLYFGAPNAGAVAGVLQASFDAWLATSSPSSIGDFTLFWTHMQRGSDMEFSALVANGVTPAQSRAAWNASESALGRMRASLNAIDPSAVPSSNPLGLSGAVRAVNVSAGYLPCYFSWREAGLGDAVLRNQSKPSPDDCTAQGHVLAALTSAVASFDAAFPTESADWFVGSMAPYMYSRPNFFTGTQPTMAAWAQVWAGRWRAMCGGAVRAE